jgi:hypothetical protein
VTGLEGEVGKQEPALESELEEQWGYEEREKGGE